MLALRTDPSALPPSNEHPEVASPARRIRTWLRFALVVGAVALMVAGSPLVAASGTTAPSSGAVVAPVPYASLAALPQSAGVLPAGAADVGAVALSTPVSFNIEINLPDAAAAQAYVTAIYTPGSPTYHQYVTGAQYVALFGPSPTERASLLQYFRSFGLTVVPLDQLGLLYGVSGSAAQVNSALHVTMSDFRHDGQTRMAPDGVPSLPSGLAPWVESFHNLNLWDVATPDYALASPATPAAVMTPDDLQGAYDASPLITGGDTGNKETIGLAEICDPSQAYTTYQTDVNNYDSANGLPAITLTVQGTGVSGSCSPGSSGWGLETDLDIQSSHSLAPGAALVVCLDVSDPTVCDSAFVSAKIPFGSNSWGGGGPYTSIWSAAAAAGVTLLASAGDSCGLSTPNDPSLEPDGIGVGGTSLTVTGTAWTSEVVWDTSCTTVGGGGEGTGGGCDASVAPPAWQIGMSGYPGACSTTSERGVPDVAADADPATGISIYTSNSGCTSPCQIGGTSLACPLWAASLALIYQSSGFAGFFGPEVYTLAKSSKYSTYFHDITSGTNGFAATAGWDPATGVGTPDIAQIAAGVIPPLVVSVSSSDGSVEAGTSVTFTASVSGGNLPYSFSWTHNVSVSLGCPSSAICTWVPTHPGNYVITVTVTDPAGASASATIALKVTPGPEIVSFSATPANVEAGMTVTLSVSVTAGTPSYFYVWTLNGTNTTNPASGISPTASWIAPDHAGAYDLGVVVYDAVGATARASAQINVYARVAAGLLMHPLSPIDANSNVTLIGEVFGGDGPVTVNFLVNGSVFDSDSDVASPGQVLLPWTPKGGTYTLSVQVIDLLGFEAWAPNVTYVVNGFLTLSLPTPTPDTVDVGAQVTFNAQTGGGTFPLVYTWTVNGAVVAGATGASYSTIARSPGTISAWVMVSDAAYRLAYSNWVNVTVNPDPTVKIQGPSVLGPSTSGSFSATVTGGTGPFSYLWSVNGTVDSGASGTTYSFSESNGGQFVVNVEVIDATGATVFAYKAVTVTPSNQGLIVGTTVIESYAIIGGLIVFAAIVAVLYTKLHRKKPKTEGAMAAPAGPWAPVGGGNAPAAAALPAAGAGAAAAPPPAVAGESPPVPELTPGSFCASCGAPQDPNSVLCAKCGAPYGAPGPSGAGAPPSGGMPPGPPGAP